MTEILAALAMGILAGTIDAAPMLWMRGHVKAPFVSVVSTFATWVFLGLVIPFVDWDLTPWVKGAVLAFAGMTPTMLVLWVRNRKAIVPTAVMTLALGAGIGWVGARWVVG